MWQHDKNYVWSSRTLAKIGGLASTLQRDRPHASAGYNLPIALHNPGGATSPIIAIVTNGCQHGSVTMVNVELIKVEERPGGQLLFNVRVAATVGKIESSIAIKDQGSVASNETAVLQSALGFAKESLRMQKVPARTRYCEEQAGIDRVVPLDF